MNLNALARNYDVLTPEERFRLILAASGRGDDAERDRLVNAAVTRTWFAPDHYPYANAFDEMALLTFIELLEAAAFFLECLDRADSPDPFDDAAEAEGAEAAAGAEGDEADAGEKGGRDEEGRGKKHGGERSLDIALAAGYILRTKFSGWQKFCQGLNANPFLMWEGLPGFDRLRRALDLAERTAFTPEGMLRWLNAIRPAGEPERIEVALTIERAADGAEALFKARVEWWGG